MLIFVSGPYSGNTDEEVEKNISVANEAGKQLLRKGHFPFVPHTMMKSWQGSEGLAWEDVVGADFVWIEKCDGFLFLGASPGSNLELKQAKRLGLQIFSSIDEVPPVDEVSSKTIKHNESQLQMYLTEYKDCADSYRHTYQTIWQAGAIFIAASSIIVAWALRGTGFTPLPALLAPLPFLFWFLAIFLPMDAYGHFRSEHLEEIEEKLNSPPYCLSVSHYTKYNRLREAKKLGVGITTRVVGWVTVAYWVSSLIAWSARFFIDLPLPVKYIWPWLF